MLKLFPHIGPLSPENHNMPSFHMRKWRDRGESTSSLAGSALSVDFHPTHKGLARESKEDGQVQHGTDRGWELQGLCDIVSRTEHILCVKTREAEDEK